jgi:uncharacterized membrane protein
MSVPTPEHIMNTDRLEALADGIFAFAVTLLVLSIDLPANIPRASANQAILQYMMNLMPGLGIYAIGFLWESYERASEAVPFYQAH